MNSRVPSMKQMVVQKRHTFAAGLKNERESRRIIFLKEYDETDDDRHL